MQLLYGMAKYGVKREGGGKTERWLQASTGTAKGGEHPIRKLVNKGK